MSGRNHAQGEGPHGLRGPLIPHQPHCVVGAGEFIPNGALHAVEQF